MKDLFCKIIQMNTYVYGQGNYFRSLRTKSKNNQKGLAGLIKLDLSCIVDGEGNKTGIALKHFIELGKIIGINEEKILEDLKYAKMRFLGSSLFFCLDDYGKILFNDPKIQREQFELDVWKTDFRVIISDLMIDKIKDTLTRLSGPYFMYKITGITPTIYYRLCARKGIGVHSYYNLIRFLGFDLVEAENAILKVTYFGCNKEYAFIKKVNPLVFRVACHVIGDGSNPSRNTFRWIQKNKNSGGMITLIKHITNTYPKTIQPKDCDSNHITIVAYFYRLLKYGMNIDMKAIKSAKTIGTFLTLPKDYLIQLLAAFIVDEGCIRSKNAKSLILSQSKEDVLMEFVKILDKLGYEHSGMQKEISNPDLKKYANYTMFRVNIYAKGVFKFYNDLQGLISQYGPLAGLWHKQDKLEEYIRTCRCTKGIQNSNLVNKKTLLDLPIACIGCQND